MLGWASLVIPLWIWVVPTPAVPFLIKKRQVPAEHNFHEARGVPHPLPPTVYALAFSAELVCVPAAVF